MFLYMFIDLLHQKAPVLTENANSRPQYRQFDSKTQGLKRWGLYFQGAHIQCELSVMILIPPEIWEILSEGTKVYQFCKPLSILSPNGENAKRNLKLCSLLWLYQPPTEQTELTEACPTQILLLLREVKIKHANVRIRTSRNLFFTIYDHFKTRLLKIRVTEGGVIITGEKKGYTRRRAFRERKAHKGREVWRDILIHSSNTHCSIIKCHKQLQTLGRH